MPWLNHSVNHPDNAFQHRGIYGLRNVGVEASLAGSQPIFIASVCSNGDEHDSVAEFFSQHPRYLVTV